MKTTTFTNRGAFYDCSEPGDQSGEYVKAEVARLLYDSAVACHAWHVAESNYLGTFNERSELCSYSELATRRALAAVRGETFEEVYEGVPRILIDVQTWEVARVTATEGEARELVRKALEAVK